MSIFYSSAAFNLFFCLFVYIIRSSIASVPVPSWKQPAAPSSAFHLPARGVDVSLLCRFPNFQSRNIGRVGQHWSGIRRSRTRQLASPFAESDGNTCQYIDVVIVHQCGRGYSTGIRQHRSSRWLQQCCQSRSTKVSRRRGDGTVDTTARAQRAV